MTMWPALTVVANTAPKEIKAPAKTLSARVVIRSFDALLDAGFLGANGHVARHDCVERDNLRRQEFGRLGRAVIHL